ncbi:MAG TPA: UDP-N-acetylmuramate--L-alanine ligase, partial [Longimicrobiales bacterium]|nr:UDP-N-acetylmuramate--L-alanine ligase [Longimicrobiales bacterium]
MTGVDLRSLAEQGVVHFVGVGGAGMCALAELLLRSGGRVSGCDLKESPALGDLSALGAPVHVGHDRGHVSGCSAVVMTSAIPPDHPEIDAARQAGTPVLKRAEALGAWVQGGTVVAVAGTHGKTTTTAMVTEILAHAGRDPTGLVGGRVLGWHGNLRFGGGSLFVVEADEYDRSFLHLVPDVAVVTNVEADHLDVYGDFEGVREGFTDFLSRVRPHGRAVICADDQGASSLLPPLGPRGYTYGASAGSMLRATDLEIGPRVARCRVFEEGRRVGALVLRGGGRHNLTNALGAAGAARALDVPWSAILEALEGFSGVARRFERLGEAAGVSVVDDYAHHPTEIRVTLETIRTVFGGA